jgi:fused signal recognition particle receptor
MLDFFKKKPVEDAAKATKKAAEKTTKKSVATPEIAPATIKEPASFTQRLKQSLNKTRNLLGGQLASLFGGGKIDAETYEEL